MRKRALGLAVAIIVGAFVVSASGAATTKAQTGKTINVSTRAAVIHYLRSIHVSTKHAVIQRGLRNYAGAHCPGRGWTCAGTKHTVVQIAKRGGQNRYACSTAKCAVVQVGRATLGLKATSKVKPPPPPPPSGNTASCIKTTGITQSCVINQPNATGTNTAVVYMVTPKLTGLTQSATYSASITQGPGSAAGSSNTNIACVRQSVTLDGSTTKTNGASTTVTNDSHQSITINQNSLTGNNTVQGATQNGCAATGSSLTQDEVLTSTVTSKGSITQLQDTATTGSANVVTDIEQNQGSGFKGFASGVNNATFEQSTNQSAIANTVSGATVTQQQNANVPLEPFSGLVGTINQDSSALSSANVTQTETQCQDAVSSRTTPTQCDMVNHDPPEGINLTQTQYGPEGVLTLPKKTTARVPFAHKGYGKSEQTGAAANVHDIFGLTQTSTQNADVGSGQQNLVQGDCSSAGGSCTTSQQTSLNSGTTQDGWTAPSIGNININCPKGQDCVPTAPPDPTFISGPTSPHPSSSAAFDFSDTATGGVHFLCKIDGGTAQENVVDPCSPNVAFFQDYGAHTFQVAASDRYGNVSDYVPSTAFSWTNVPPDPTITSSAPPNPDFSNNSYTFTFKDADTTGVQFQCTLDGVTQSCVSGVTYSDLPAGPHKFTVTAYGVNDSTLSYPDTTPPSVEWTTLGISVSAFGSQGLTNDAAIGTDGSKAGWECKPGGPIALQVGSVDNAGNTYAQIGIDNAAGTPIDGMVEPSFTTDNFISGSPRYVIILSNGDILNGLPPNPTPGESSTGMSWEINYGWPPMSWSDVLTAEAGTTVTDAFVVADGSQELLGPGVTPNTAPDDIFDLTFNGTPYNSGTCP